MKESFFNTENNSFYIEDIFVEYDGPLFFMCKDRYNSRYFVEAGPSNSTEAKWVLVKASDKIINDVLNNRISLYNLFKEAEENQVLLITTSFTEMDTVEHISSNMIPDDLLPSPGYYLDLDDEPSFRRKSDLGYIPSFKEKNYYPTINVSLKFEDPDNHSIEATQAATILQSINELRQSLLLSQSEKNISRIKKDLEPALFTGIHAGSVVFQLESQERMIGDDNSFRYLYDLLDISNDESLESFLQRKSPAVPRRYIQLMANVINAKADLGLTYISSDSDMEYKTSVNRQDLERRVQFLKNTILVPETIQMHGILFGYDQNKKTFSFYLDELDSEENEDAIQKIISGSLDSDLYEKNLKSDVTVNSKGIATIKKEVTFELNIEKTKYTLMSFEEAPPALV